MPSQVGSSAMSCVHCVIARTKTRSKKSSSGVTDSPCLRVALILRVRVLVPLSITRGRMSGASA